MKTLLELFTDYLKWKYFTNLRRASQPSRPEALLLLNGLLAKENLIKVKKSRQKIVAFYISGDGLAAVTSSPPIITENESFQPIHL